MYFLRGTLAAGKMLELWGQRPTEMLHRLRIKLPGAVTRSHQRPCHYPCKANPAGKVSVSQKFFWLHPPIDWMVQRRGPQVLSNRDDVAACCMEIDEGFLHFSRFFPHTENEIRFGDEPIVVCLGKHG